MLFKCISLVHPWSNWGKGQGGTKRHEIDQNTVKQGIYKNRALCLTYPYGVCSILFFCFRSWRNYFHCFTISYVFYCGKSRWDRNILKPYFSRKVRGRGRRRAKEGEAVQYRLQFEGYGQVRLYVDPNNSQT